MRSVRNVVLLSALTLAAMAVAASSASALSVVRESTGVACPAVTTINHGPGSGGCLIRVVSEAPVEYGSPLGMVFCNNTFEARVDSTGNGYIYAKTMTACTPVQFFPCDESGLGEDPWPIRLLSETSFEFVECKALGSETGPQLTCHMAGLAIAEEAGLPLHRYVFRTVDRPVPPATMPHQACEDGVNSLRGRWHTVIDATHTAIEIRD